MHITQLRMENFRNFPSLQFDPSPQLNIIHGDNGAGKSSILEALHFLGFGRSFRTNKPDSVINHELDVQSSATVFATYYENEESQGRVGLTRHKKDGYQFNLNGTRVTRLADLVRQIPLQIFTPQSSDLVLGAPVLRRRFIDWLLFHVEHSFQLHNANYTKVLKQRNAWLKTLADKRQEKPSIDDDSWLEILATNANHINELRKRYIEALNNELVELYSELNPEFSVEIRYNQGWEKERELRDVLHQKFDNDIFRGHTSYGPHKADIQFFVNEKSAVEFLSRGQLRVLVSLLLIAEVRVLKKITGKNCILLVDDIAAELDAETRQFFLEKVLQDSTQVFVTAIEKGQLPFLDNYKNKKMFHVKHNNVFEE